MTTDTMHGSANGTAPSEDQAPEKLQDAASGLLDQAGRTASSQASKTMDRAGETLEQVARVVRDSGNQLRAERPEIAGVVDTVAERVDQASTYLREHDAQEVFGEVERFARRQPAVVIGGGLAIGLLLGRLLRSGAEPMTSGMSGSSGQRSPLAGSASWPSGSTPGGAYGTGYGATYDPGLTADSTSLDAGSVDDSLTDTSTSSAKSTSTTSKRRSRSTGAD